MKNQLSVRVLSRESDKVAASSGIGGLDTIIETSKLVVQGIGVIYDWKNSSGDRFLVFGSVIGLRRVDGSISDATAVRLDFASFEDSNRIREVEGRFVVLKISEGEACEVWTDQFGRADVYWQLVEGGVVLGTGMDILPVAQHEATPSIIGIAHSLTVYGSRPAKQQTLYDEVKRLGVDQGISVSGGKIDLLTRNFVPVPTGKFGKREHHEYAEILLEAIRARASKDGNIVYLSSGWDSTSILSCLVHLFGNRKVRAIIGRMRYADRSGVINQIEVDRATAVAEYFNVPLEICETDYRTGAHELVEKVRPLFRAQQFANITGVGHWLLAEHAAKTATGDETIFAGEMSDGAHNLGFSQFVTIFHSASHDFREYSDKMASYLFGPTFLREVLGNRHESDPVWQLFRQRAGSTKFDAVAPDAAHRTKQFLASFFLRGGRLPFVSLENAKLLTGVGQSTYSTTMEKIYLNHAGALATPETLYAWYLHLYNSFHWQGATVSTLEHTANAHGLRCVLPFHDSRLIEFLSAMPESWGRGLDLRSTKYPLKWMLQNKIDYPMHLQVGPHSYLYDTDPSFSHAAEVLFASSFSRLFKEALASKDFQARLDPATFDHTYINGIVSRYLKNEEFRGAEMNDLGVLAWHSVIGCYGG